MNNIQTKRVYEEIEQADDFRVLVDRIWPRGMNKQSVKTDQWMKKVAPSTELRKWFNHDPKKWEEFKDLYYMELEEKTDVINSLIKVSKDKNLTLLYSSKDKVYNHALALKEYLLIHAKNI